MVTGGESSSLVSWSKDASKSSTLGSSAIGCALYQLLRLRQYFEQLTDSYRLALNHLEVLGVGLDEPLLRVCFRDPQHLDEERERLRTSPRCGQLPKSFRLYLL